MSDYLFYCVDGVIIDQRFYKEVSYLMKLFNVGRLAFINLQWIL